MRDSTPTSPIANRNSIMLAFLLDARACAARQSFTAYLLDMAIDETMSGMTDAEFWACIDKHLGVGRSGPLQPKPTVLRKADYVKQTHRVRIH